MKFLYATDLHGDETKFEKLFEISKDLNIDLIHIGADILPKDIDGCLNIYKQGDFIRGFLYQWYIKCLKNNINILMHFGNDDLLINKYLIERFYPLLGNKQQRIKNYTFKSYDYVLDNPFGLKDMCKLDYKGWRRPKYIQKPVNISTYGYNYGFSYDILDIKKYFKNKSTIEEDLSKTKAGNRTIMSMHMPPYGLGLDVCGAGKRVGSKSVYDWIDREQPLLVLCGHMHESFKTSGIWKASIGNSLVLQPGQSEKLHFVEIHIKNHDIAAKLHTI